MAFGVLAAENNTAGIVVTTTAWQDLVPAMTVTAPGGLVRFDGYVANDDGTIELQILVDSVVLSSGNANKNLENVSSLAAGSHTINFQGKWTGGMVPTGPSVMDAGFTAIALA